MFAYIVCCQFAPGAEAVADRWLEWLGDRHLQDVLDCGAQSVEVIEFDGPTRSFEIHYRFADRAAYDRYVDEHAPRLRAEGLSLFPLEQGLAYSRRNGEVRIKRP